MNLEPLDVVIWETHVLVIRPTTDAHIIHFRDALTDQVFQFPRSMLDLWDWSQIVVVRPRTREIMYHNPQAMELGWDPKTSEQTADAWLCEQLRSARHWTNLPDVPECKLPLTAALQLLAADNWHYATVVGSSEIPADFRGIAHGERIRAVIALLFKFLEGAHRGN